jgi:hypothetical protein
MKIKKNGKVINLTEGDLKRIVKKVLNETDGDVEECLRKFAGKTWFDIMKCCANKKGIKEEDLEKMKSKGDLIKFLKTKGDENQRRCIGKSWGEYIGMD